MMNLGVEISTIVEGIAVLILRWKLVCLKPFRRWRHHHSGRTWASSVSLVA